MSAQATWISELPEENQNASFEVEDATSTVAFDTHIIGNSAVLRRALDMVRVVAPTDATALINGATGTGKELIAEAIHKCSDRSNGPFVKVNCAAIPAGLLVSELVWHERGGFTGSISRRHG